MNDDDVMAFRIGDIITNNPASIRAALDRRVKIVPVTRRMAQVMVRLDLDSHGYWSKLAQEEAMFTAEEAPPCE